MPYIFWIDYTAARRKFVELLFNNCSWSKVYTLESFDSLIFRFDDLLPQAVVLDEAELSKYSGNLEIIQQIKERKMPIIHRCDENDSLQLKDLSLGKISRTIDSAYLLKELELKCSKNVCDNTDHQTNKFH